jgi:hypothetical protein
VRWIKSAGGPLVAMRKDLAPSWRGILGNSSWPKMSTETMNTDYSRACDIKDYVGIIDVSDGNAIVLGDMPLSTTVWTDTGSKIFIIRAFYMGPDQDINLLMIDMNEEELKNVVESVDFTVFAQKMVIFDSALPGERFEDECLSFSMPLGKYIILTYELKPNARTSLLLHRFQSVI